MNLFELDGDWGPWGDCQPYDIYADRKWGLPGVSCPACGQSWASLRSVYRRADLSSLPETVRQLLNGPPWSVAPAEFEARRRLVEAALPPGTELLPGTDLGPLVGAAYGVFDDFSWGVLGTVLVRRGVLERFTAAGLEPMGALETEIRYGGQPWDDFRERDPCAPLPHRQVEGWTGEPWLDFAEWDLPVIAGLAPAATAAVRPTGPRCAECGYQPQTGPWELVVDPSSVRPGVSVGRVDGWWGRIVATERFIETAASLGVTGLAWRNLAMT